MLHRSLMLATSISCLSCFVSNSSIGIEPESLVSGKSFYIQYSKEREFRNGASHRLMINGTQLVAVGSLDVASEEWKEIHRAVEKLRAAKGFNGLLHIQYFFERGTQPRRLRETKIATKVALADIDLYVACIDGQYRNDDVKWKSDSLDTSLLKTPGN